MGPMLTSAYAGSWTRPDIPVSELCSGNCEIVGDPGCVRADSSVVSWLNVRVTDQVQDTSLRSYHSPFENPPGDDAQ